MNGDEMENKMEGCLGYKCPVRKNCKRYTPKIDRNIKYIAPLITTLSKGCEFYIPIKKM